MFKRTPLSYLFLLCFFVVLATATTTTTITVTAPAPTSTPLPASQCGTGNLQCCNSLERSDGSVVGLLLGLLGVVLQGVEALVGITCSPIDILGIGQNSCDAQPVCCQNNNFDGIIAIGCVPININL
ncbi:fungal hydrophobin-domain-containing protein [Infundibulicybe gibba]|nr:fungal hydrophobin-domain-containing protein [Infundibulicybe gibba]